jgi:hypothetical protein
VKTAVIANIHGNYEALSAVIKNIEKRNIQDVVCLGNIWGYGPDVKLCHEKCLEICSDLTLGSSDRAMIIDREKDFCLSLRYALEVIKWQSSLVDKNLKRQIYNFFPYVRKNKMFFCYFYFSAETHWLVGYGKKKRTWTHYPNNRFSNFFRDDIPKNEETVICGHKYIPGYYSGYEFIPVCEESISLEKSMVFDAGSVGQPRDEDPRACYLVIDHKTKECYWPRVEYDFNKTIEKIKENPHINNLMGERLKYGR